MASYINPITQKVYQILLPLIGDMMTKGVLKTQSGKLGKTEENLIPDDLPTIAEGIRKGLSTFLGSDAALQVANKIASIR